jgi:hypothetical protein
MDLLNMILNQGNGRAVRELAGNFGLDETQATSALSGLLPVLAKGLARNASTPGGLDSLLGALGGGNHARYLEDPSILAREESINDGNGILGHILGSKEVSRKLADRTAESTGIGADILKKMLPMVASLAMGALSQQTAQARQTRGASPADGLTGMLGQFLDADRDGSVADDLLGMAARFLRNR